MPTVNCKRFERIDLFPKTAFNSSLGPIAKDYANTRTSPVPRRVQESLESIFQASERLPLRSNDSILSSFSCSCRGGFLQRSEGADGGVKRGPSPVLKEPTQPLHGSSTKSLATCTQVTHRERSRSPTLQKYQLLHTTERAQSAARD